MYKPNPKEFNDLDREDMKKDKHNIISPSEFEEVHEEYVVCDLIVNEVSGNSQVELPEEVSIVLVDLLNICLIELFESLPLICDKEDEIDPNLLIFVQSISNKSFSAHGHKPKRHINLCHTKLSKLDNSFAYKVHDLHIQANNKQYKLEVDLYRYHDAFNVWYYLMI